MKPVLRPERYSTVAITLHWLVAALMLANLALVWSINAWPDDWVRPVVDTHKSIGLTVLGLAALRLLWRWGHRPPPLPAGYPGWERRLAGAGHAVLYALMILLPLSGYIHDSAWKAAATHPFVYFGVLPWPRIGWIMALDPATKESVHSLFAAIHRYFGYALYLMVGLHLAGALKHQLWDREPELQRMWPR